MSSFSQWFIVGMVIAVANKCRAADSTNTLSMEEHFKQFITSPPALTKLIYKEKLLANPAIPQNEDVGLENSTNYQTFLARWQPDGFVVRPIAAFGDDDDSAAPSNLAVSVYRNIYWALDPIRQAVVWHRNSLHATPESEPNLQASNFVFAACQFHKRKLYQVVNMGIFGVDIGSIKWNSNSFQATSTEFHQSVRGTLHISPSGIPTFMDVLYQGSERQYQYQVRYSYLTDTGVGFIPSEITCLQIHNGNEHERSVYKVLLVQTNKNELPAHYFDLGLTAAANNIPIAHLTNGSYIELQAAELGSRFIPKTRARKRYEGALIVFLVVTFVSSFAFLVTTIRNLKLKQTQNERIV